MYIPTLGRFTKNIETNNYEKRVILGDSVYRILIPFDKWNVLHTKSIQRWILRNKNTPDQPFQWGKFMKEVGVTPAMITENLCERCGLINGCFKSNVDIWRHVHLHHLLIQTHHHLLRLLIQVLNN